VKVFQYKDSPIGKPYEKIQSLKGIYTLIVIEKRLQNLHPSFRLFLHLPQQAFVSGLVATENIIFD